MIQQKVIWEYVDFGNFHFILMILSTSASSVLENIYLLVGICERNKSLSGQLLIYQYEIGSKLKQNRQEKNVDIIQLKTRVSVCNELHYYMHW